MSDNVTAYAISPLLTILIPVVTFILGLLGKIFYDMWHDNYIEKKRIQSEGCKNHFKRLEARIIKRLIELTEGIFETSGQLLHREENVPGYSNPGYVWSLIKDFQVEEYHVFQLHFPSQAKKIMQIMDDVKRHNETVKSFVKSLDRVIGEKTGLPLMKRGKPPFIYERVSDELYSVLLQLARRKLTGNENIPIMSNFNEANVKKRDAYWRLELGEGVTAFADANTEEEANSCKLRLIELQESRSLLEELYPLLEKAVKLREEASSLANSLDFLCYQYRELEHLLNEENGCPYCQVIFYPKKGGKLETI